MTGSIIDSPVSWSDVHFSEPQVEHHAESEAHKQKKIEIAKQHLSDGWIVGVELKEPTLGYVIDVVAERNGTTKVIEVGSVTERKLENLKREYDEFQHVGYEDTKQVVSRERKSISVTISENALERLENMPPINRSRFMKEATIEKMEELGY